MASEKKLQVALFPLFRRFLWTLINDFIQPTCNCDSLLSEDCPRGVTLDRATCRKRYREMKSTVSNPKLQETNGANSKRGFQCRGSPKCLQNLLLDTTLWRLAEWPEHRVHIRNSLGMMEQLQALMARSSHSVQELAKRVHSLLCSVPAHHAHPSAHAPLRDTGNHHSSHKPTEKTASKTRRRNSFFVGDLSQSKMIVLQIRGINDKEDVELCRNCLLTVKGVISITFDTKKRRAIMRTRPDLKPELLAAAIARTMTMYAEQVVKDEQGNEFLLSFGSKAQYANKENEGMPDYPEEISPIRGDKNMARLGGTEPKKAGLFNSIGKFLSNSFYW